MIIIFETKAADDQIKAVQLRVESLGLQVHRSDGVDHTILGVVGDRRRIEDIHQFRALDGVKDVIPISTPYKLVSREFHPDDSIVYVRDVPIGGQEVVAIAGPCSIESAEQIETIAAQVSASGARILRGGAFKPRSSPYSFQGHGQKGLEMIKRASKKYNLPVVTEVMATDQIDLVCQYADLLQVGTRNMQNFNLLTELGKCGKPVILKRGLSATIEEWLMSAEYILAAGNPNVILCERGIRTFETATRNTLDLSAVTVIKHLSHLPIVVDPSHAVGYRKYVMPMARASVAAGADGIMIEVHSDPDNSFSDGAQTITPDQFTAMMNRCRIIATTLGRRIAKGS